MLICTLWAHGASVKPESRSGHGQPCPHFPQMFLRAVEEWLTTSPAIAYTCSPGLVSGRPSRGSENSSGKDVLGQWYPLATRSHLHAAPCPVHLPLTSVSHRPAGLSVLSLTCPPVGSLPSTGGHSQHFPPYVDGDVGAGRAPGTFSYPQPAVWFKASDLVSCLSQGACLQL